MDGAWATNATSSNNSALPTALIGFSIAIVPEVDNAYYDCATNGFSGSKTSLFAALTDSSNWTTSNTLPNTSNCSSFNVLSNPSSVVVSITVDSNVSCNGLTNGGATALAYGGVSPYSYTWSNGDTVASSTNLSAGSYTVLVVDSLGFRARKPKLSTTNTVYEPADRLVEEATVSPFDQV